MTTDTLTPRQRMVAQLADDLNVQGWNQKNKLWFVKGADGDEWLSFGGEFTEAPETHLVDLIADTGLPDDAHGVLVASEGWDYPQHVKAGFVDDDALRAAWTTTPPSRHPEKVEIRHIVLACKDGDVLGFTISHEDTPATKWAHVTGETPSPVGDRTVDAARALLGLYPRLVDRVRQFEGFQAIANVAAALDKAMSGTASEEEVTRELFLSLPDWMKPQVVAEMPDDVKEIVRSVLSEEERRRYGL